MSSTAIEIQTITNEKDITKKEQNPKTPPVPIKTYKWEDIKRAKQKGGYPWTHLTYPKFVDNNVIFAIKFENKMSSKNDKITDLESADLKIEENIDRKKECISERDQSVGDSKIRSEIDIVEDIPVSDHVEHTNVIRRRGNEKTEEHIYEPIQRQSALDMSSVEIQLNDEPIMEGGLENDKLLVITAVSDESVDAIEQGKGDINSSEKEVETKTETRKTPHIAEISPLEQSMSIDEEKSYLDKKILTSTSLEDDYNKWSKLTNHEYEPVNPPADDILDATSSTKQPPMVHVSDKNPEPHLMDSADEETDSMTSAERQFLRIPLDNELLVPEDGNIEDQAMAEESGDDRLNTTTPTTIGSRTDCELNTSQVDSSALEQLPLKRESRKKATLAVEENMRGQNFKEKFQIQAGKLRTKLRAIKKPNINLKKKKTKLTKSSDRPVTAKLEQRSEPEKNIPKKERTKFSMPKMPERPKINLKMPDISMPKMSEKSKITMPKMPDRPKLSMPKMPERPRISIPKMPDISMPKMPERPKINFPSLHLHRKTEMESSESKSTDTKNTGTKSSGTKSTEEEPSSTERTNQSSETSKKRVFDFKTYPRLFDKSKKPKVSSENSESTQEKTGSKSTFFTSVPDWVTIPRISRKKSDGEPKWSDKFSYLKRSDSKSQPKRNVSDIESIENNVDQNEERIVTEEEIKTDFIHIPLNPNKNIVDDQDRYEIEEINDEEQEDIEEVLRSNMLQKSALDPNMSFEEINETLRKNNNISKESINPDSAQEDHSYQSSARGGVIEEINADEFFVREKGISQDNIDVSKYISSEIREAFQTPKNALTLMSEMNKSGDSYDEQQLQFEEEFPSTTESRDIEHIEQIEQIEPPIKIARKKKQQQAEHINVNELNTKEAENIIQSETITESESIIEDQNLIENENLIESGNILIEESDVEIQNKRQEKNPFDEEQKADGNDIFIPPKRPSRHRRTSTSTKQSYDENSINIEDFQHDDNVFDDFNNQVFSNEDNINIDRPSKSPVPPLRRKRSMRSSSRNSFGIQDDGLQDISDFRDEVQQETQSLSEVIQHEDENFHVPIIPKRRLRSQSRSTIHSIDEDRTSHGADSLVSEERILSADEIPRDSIIMDTDVLPGYSVVNKQKVTEEIIDQPQTLPPPRTKRKKKRGTQFFTVPRRLKGGSPSPPQRPSRNYSTLQTRRKSRDRSTSNISQSNITEDKENIPDSETTQYIEIDDDDSTPRHFLQSGEVIEKMKTRPLPAPPRPPRKSKGIHEVELSENVLRDVTADNTLNILRRSGYNSEENIIIDSKEQLQKETIPDPTDEKNASEILQEIKDFITEVQTIKNDDVPKDVAEDTVIKKQHSSQETVLSPEQIIQSKQSPVVEVDISTQTDPLPDDFCCEEVVQEPTDIIIAPTRRRKKSKSVLHSRTNSTVGISTDDTPSEQNIASLGESFIISDPSTGEVTVLPRAKSPVNLTEIVQDRPSTPVCSIEDTEFSKEKHSFVSSEISQITPEHVLVTQLVPEQQESKSDPQTKSCMPENDTNDVQLLPPIQQSQTPTPVMTLPETLKIDRLQVGDLDVERLTVSELLSQKLLVSEIDGMSLKVNDVSSHSGNLVIDGIELSPLFFQQLFEKLPGLIQEHLSSSTEPAQKTSTDEKPAPNEEKPITFEKSTSIDETNLPLPLENIIQPEMKQDSMEQETIVVDIAKSTSGSENIEPTIVTKDIDLQSSTKEKEQISSESKETTPLPIKESNESVTTDSKDASPTQHTEEQIQAPPRRRKSLAQDQAEPSREQSFNYQYPQHVNYANPPNIVQGIMYPHIYVLPPSFYPVPSPQSSAGNEPIAGPSNAQSKKSQTKEDVPDPSIPELSVELLRACSTSANKTIKQILIQISSHLNSSGNRHDTKTVFTILIILIAGLILLGMGRGGDTVHHHHWEYFNPPGDKQL